MKHYKNIGEKTVHAKSLKGHWYSFKAGQLLEVEDEDAKHLAKRGLVEQELSSKQLDDIKAKQKEKAGKSKNKAVQLAAEMKLARGKIVV